MHVIYDVSHNIAKVEEHMVDGKQRTLLVHRKGSTRAFPPHHPLIPVDYQVLALQTIYQIIDGRFQSAAEDLNLLFVAV